MTTGQAAPRARRGLAARAAGALLLAAAGFVIPLAARAGAPPAGLDAESLAGQVAALGAEQRRIADESDRLRGQQAALAAATPDPAALASARREADTLAVAAGLVAVTGPGIEVTVDDPRGNVGAEVLVDALQELRDAGAEAIELSGVRLAARSYVLDRPGGGLTVDGRAVQAPYRLVALGDAHTLAEAMRFPGGVLDTVAARAGATARVTESAGLVIHATRPAAVTAAPSA